MVNGKQSRKYLIKQNRIGKNSGQRMFSTFRGCRLENNSV